MNLVEHELEFGLDSFGEVPGGDHGSPVSEASTIRLMIEEAQLAESVGIDSFNIGEHYRPNHVDSAGHVILAAIAARTKHLRVGTAVTVLSTRDLVRLFNEFSTLQAISDGRAQLIVGRGSSADSFPLFGYDLAEYESLFEEKLELLDQLVHNQPVTWNGTTRSKLTDQTLTPALQTPLPVWVGVGGNPQSVVRAARHRMPLMLAVVSGRPSRMAPLAELYRQSTKQLGHPDLPIGEHSAGYIAETDNEAQATFWPQWNDALTLASKERGFSPPTRRQFDRDVTEGALFVGSPTTVAAKIADTAMTLGLSRFDLKYDMGRLTPQQRASSIELLGTEVIPQVRRFITTGHQESKAPHYG